MKLRRDHLPTYFGRHFPVCRLYDTSYMIHSVPEDTTHRRCRGKSQRLPIAIETARLRTDSQVSFRQFECRDSFCVEGHWMGYWMKYVHERILRTQSSPNKNSCITKNDVRTLVCPLFVLDVFSRLHRVCSGGIGPRTTEPARKVRKRRCILHRQGSTI